MLGNLVNKLFTFILVALIAANWSIGSLSYAQVETEPPPNNTSQQTQNKPEVETLTLEETNALNTEIFEADTVYTKTHQN